MPRPGSGYRCHTTGQIHAENGFPTQNPEAVERSLGRLLTKLDAHRETIDASEALGCEDAEVLVVAIGISARAAARAVRECRAQGIRAGLFRPITLWPFPEQALVRAAARAHSVLVPELNAGQLRLEVERVLDGEATVSGLNRIDGNPIDPAQIVQAVAGLARPRIHAANAVSFLRGER
jgi:2-oxoglutarate ferredoxin oxidoreductase subunit alpha